MINPMKLNDFVLLFLLCLGLGCEPTNKEKAKSNDIILDNSDDDHDDVHQNDFWNTKTYDDTAMYSPLDTIVGEKIMNVITGE